LRFRHRRACYAIGESLQRCQKKYDNSRHQQSGKVTELSRQEAVRSFGKHEYESHDDCRKGRPFDGPADTQIDVEEMRSQDAIGNEWNRKDVPIA
jgi:hypothetical protein